MGYPELACGLRNDLSQEIQCLEFVPAQWVVFLYNSTYIPLFNFKLRRVLLNWAGNGQFSLQLRPIRLALFRQRPKIFTTPYEAKASVISWLAATALMPMAI